jgi:cytochrome c biogenesis factor
MLQFSATFTDLIIIGKHEMRTASGLHTQVSTFSRHIVNLKKITQTYGTLLHSNTKFAATGFCVVFHVFVLTVRLPITWGTDQTCRVEHTFRYIHAIVGSYSTLMIVAGIVCVWRMSSEAPPLRINRKSMKTLDKTELSWHCDLAKFRNNHVQPEIGFFLRRPRK